VHSAAFSTEISVVSTLQAPAPHFLASQQGAFSVEISTVFSLHAEAQHFLPSAHSVTFSTEISAVATLQAPAPHFLPSLQGAFSVEISTVCWLHAEAQHFLPSEQVSAFSVDTVTVLELHDSLAKGQVAACEQPLDSDEHVIEATGRGASELQPPHSDCEAEQAVDVAHGPPAFS
jgi:hypothetical protein